MSEKRLIGIALFPKEVPNVDISELAAMKIYQTREGRYRFPEREVIDQALEQVLEAKDNSREAMVFLVLEVVEQGEKRRRRRRRSRAKAQGGES